MESTNFDLHHDPTLTPDNVDEGGDINLEGCQMSGFNYEQWKFGPRDDLPVQILISEASLRTPMLTEVVSPTAAVASDFTPTAPEIVPSSAVSSTTRTRRRLRLQWMRENREEIRELWIDEGMSREDLQAFLNNKYRSNLTYVIISVRSILSSQSINSNDGSLYDIKDGLRMMHLVKKLNPEMKEFIAHSQEEAAASNGRSYLRFYLCGDLITVERVKTCEKSHPKDCQSKPGSM